MRELSLNVLDIAQNSIVAGAGLIEISMAADVPGDRLVITVRDNGKGMSDEQTAQVTDPFYTTRTTRKIGLGIPLFKMAAEMAGGEFAIWSELLEGTALYASFGLAHVDRMPAGDFASTVCALIHMNPELDFIYTQSVETSDETVFFVLDTRVLREMLEGVSLAEPDVSVWLQNYAAEATAMLAKLCPGL